MKGGVEKSEERSKKKKNSREREREKKRDWGLQIAVVGERKALNS